MDTTIEILEHVPLAPFSTLGVGGPARFYTKVATPDALASAIHFANENAIPFFLLGGGSNILIGDKGFPGLVIQLSSQKITCTTADPDTVRVTADAGVVWDDLVLKCIDNGLYGIENLSYIPGTVGAAPIQNIGAYGQELSDTLFEVVAFDTATKALTTLSRDECELSYRDSFFKKEAGRRFIVMAVTLALKSHGSPDISYKDLAQYFHNRDSATPSLVQVREALRIIRTEKFGSLGGVGTAGSFFKNPVLSRDHFEKLKHSYPDIPMFEIGADTVKVPLAWILEFVCGLKGYKRGTVSLSIAQPLVLKNSGTATARDIECFAQEIQERVSEATGIKIEWEVQKIFC